MSLPARGTRLTMNDYTEKTDMSSTTSRITVPQFSLAEFLLWVAGLSAALAAIYWLASLGLVLALACALAFVPYRLGFFGMHESSAAAIAIGTLGLTMVPFDNGSREAAKRTHCANNLKQLGLALQNYHDTYGTFPPAYIADKKGQPMHSWRALILPFIEQEALYKQYRFDEAWNGPNNVKLHAQMPGVFRCASDKSSYDDHTTSYLAIIGPRTIWPGDQSASLKDVTDNTSETALLAESHDSGIHWLEPRDLYVGQMTPTVNARHGQGISGLHSSGSGAWIVCVDGMISFLENDLPQHQLRGILTINGGETIADP